MALPRSCNRSVRTCLRTPYIIELCLNSVENAKYILCKGKYDKICTSSCTRTYITKYKKHIWKPIRSFLSIQNCISHQCMCCVNYRYICLDELKENIVERTTRCIAKCNFSFGWTCIYIMEFKKLVSKITVPAASTNMSVVHTINYRLFVNGAEGTKIYSVNCKTRVSSGHRFFSTVYRTIFGRIRNLFHQYKKSVCSHHMRALCGLQKDMFRMKKIIVENLGTKNYIVK